MNSRFAKKSGAKQTTKRRGVSLREKKMAARHINQNRKSTMEIRTAHEILIQQEDNEIDNAILTLRRITRIAIDR